jgi:Superinfection immunity protein
MSRFVVVRKNKPVQASVAWLVAILTLGYMLPWAIAATRGKINSGAIFWLNLLLGWTVVGWIIALVMSFSAHQAVASRW